MMQRCPLCNGVGKVIVVKQAGSSGDMVISAQDGKVCHGCEGRGLVEDKTSCPKLDDRIGTLEFRKCSSCKKRVLGKVNEHGWWCCPECESMQGVIGESIQYDRCRIDRFCPGKRSDYYKHDENAGMPKV